MPGSRSEEVMIALAAAIAAQLPVGATFERNASVPVRIPAGGWVCLRDGDPGDPDVLMSPLTYIYEHRVEVELVIELATPAARDALFDSLKQALGAVIAQDRTLGGLCDYVMGEAPVPAEVPVEGGENLKAGLIGIILTYGLSDPLA